MNNSNEKKSLNSLTLSVSLYSTNKSSIWMPKNKKATLKSRFWARNSSSMKAEYPKMFLRLFYTAALHRRMNNGYLSLTPPASQPKWKGSHTPTHTHGETDEEEKRIRLTICQHPVGCKPRHLPIRVPLNEAVIAPNQR